MRSFRAECHSEVTPTWTKTRVPRGAVYCRALIIRIGFGGGGVLSMIIV